MRVARLLLVDDEAPLAELLKKYLERLGYEVEAFTTPEAALARFEAAPEQFALVLTDLTLPGMNGEQMLERMLERNPTVKAIISSGYPHEPADRKILFLQKPFLPKMLAELIERALKES